MFQLCAYPAHWNYTVFLECADWEICQSSALRETRLKEFLKGSESTNMFWNIPGVSLGNFLSSKLKVLSQVALLELEFNFYSSKMR